MVSKISISADYIALEDKLGAHNYKPLDIVISRAEGVWVYDIDGNRYMDCLSAYSAVNQGHCHPRIIAALIDQAQKLTLTSRAFRNDQLAAFYKDLVDLTGYEMVLPMNTGVEAVESALKIARKWAYQVKGVKENQAEIITMSGNFHGRTISVVSFSTEPQYKDGFGPFTPGFIPVPYGDARAVEKTITPQTAAVILEPIQGEGGVLIPPRGFLKAIREICDRHHILFVADEIQTGLGRTGRLFACDYEGVKPDVMIIGKALGGGVYPVSAVLASKEILGLFKPGDHGSTFGGNPLAARVAREALAVIKDEKLVEKAAELGEYFMQELQSIHSPHIKEVRGKGLLIGVELTREAGGARRFCEALMREGVLAKETHQTVIRFAPPLVITREELDWALKRIDRVFSMP
jgi:ornithine--oxo-acid transaminase